MSTSRAGAHLPSVLIIGAGVIGAAAAFYLSRRGVPVTLVDGGDVGGGTSSRSDGNILAIDKDPGFDSRMALMSQDLLRQLAASLGPIEYRAPGSYLACDNAEEAEAAHEWVRLQNAEGLSFEFLDSATMHRTLPHLAPDIPGGVYCASDATLNPLLYTARLAQAARDWGAVVLPRHPVAHLVVRAGRVAGAVLVDGRVVAADMTVVAAGVWTPMLVRELGLEVPIRPRKGHLLVSARGPLFGHAKVMEFGYLMSKFGRPRQVPDDIAQAGVALVYEPTASQNFLLGSSREFVGEETEPHPRVAALIARRALRFYPGMRQSRIIRTYAGLRPWTPDHFPIVSRVQAIPGLILAAGHEGDGIGLAAVTGVLVQNLVLNETPIVDLTPLRWERFEEVPPTPDTFGLPGVGRHHPDGEDGHGKPQHDGPPGRLSGPDPVEVV